MAKSSAAATARTEASKPGFDIELKTVACLFPLLLLLPLLIGDAFIYHVFITICLYGALATAWNIVGGYAGQLSLGHGIFYGIGAYAAAFLAQAGITPWVGMGLGVVIAIAVALVISYPCFRLRGPFFALSTIAFLEVFRLLALHYKEWTGGASGLMVPLNIGWTWMIFREREPSLYIAAGLLALTLIVSAWIRWSRFGYYLIASRERDASAMAVGINTVSVRLWAVAISAGLTSMVGTFHGMYMTFVEPQAMFSLVFSIQIAMFAIIGGIGTVAGPLLGTLLVVPLTELARGWLGANAIGLHGLVYGIALILIVLFIPNGLTGILRSRFGSRPRGDAAGDESAHASSTPALPPVPSADGVRTGEPILIADGLHKRFGGLNVIGGISFSLNQGEILGIIGPNGAGKTTLFNMLSGALPPDAGSVSVRATQGQLAKPTTAYGFARAGVGRTFQIVQPFAALTVVENIMVGAFYRYPTVAEAREKAVAVANEMGLWRYRDVEAQGLTIGGLKRLEVARVMAMEPRILLLDEVMAGLNQTDVNLAIDLIQRIRASGVAVIAIEHVMHAIMSLSDRVLVLNAGSIIATGKPQEVVRDPTVIEAYLGEELKHAAAS
jgi:branched-chain amino acid transport system permease protein